MIKHEYPILVIKKVGRGPYKVWGFFFQILFYDIAFSFSSASCISIRKPRPVFVHCTRQAWFWPFVDEAEHMSAFLPVALHDSAWLKGRVGPEGRRAEPCWQIPKGNLSFLLSTCFWGFDTISPAAPFHFFQRNFTLDPVCSLFHRAGWQVRVLPKTSLQTNSVTQGRDGYCLGVKSTVVEGETGARMEGQSPLPGPGLGSGSTERGRVEEWSLFGSTDGVHIYWYFRNYSAHLLLKFRTVKGTPSGSGFFFELKYNWFGCCVFLLCSLVTQVYTLLLDILFLMVYHRILTMAPMLCCGASCSSIL